MWDVDIWCDYVEGDWLEDFHVIDEYWYVRATNQYGVRYRHSSIFVNDKLSALNLLLQYADDCDPVNDSAWEMMQPVYGSEAYSSSGGDRRWYA